MMDGSLMPDGKTPSSFEYNVKATREVVEMAHAKGVTVEGEIGCLGGIEDGHGAGLDGLSHLTDPDAGGGIREGRPVWTRWRSPSAPATAPTNSPASPRAKR